MAELFEETVVIEEDTQKDKYLIFSIDKQYYGIDIKHVIEIIGIEPITEVPELPNYVKGVINLRGKIIPVMDVRLKFKKEEKEYDDRTCIIVVEIAEISIGLIIDRVLEVISIDENNISPPPKTSSNKDNTNKYIKGIGKVQNEVRLLIDCHKFLEEDEIEELKNNEQRNDKNMAFTYFFRDLQTLEVIRDHALPYLRSKQYINIWDAGCAMGQEPYSLSMVLRETIGHMYFRNIKIFATDIDESNLFENIISEGSYPEEQIQRIPKEIFNKYFKPDKKDGYFKLEEEIKKSVTFMKHDLLSLNPPKKDFGLIICKNVLLHFNEIQRINVIKMYYNSLIEGGYLAMEQTQKLPREVQHLFEPVVSNAQVFKKI